MPLTALEAAAGAEQCTRVLASQPNSPNAARLLSGLLQRFEFGAEVDLSPSGFLAAFAFIDVDRQALCKGAFDYLKVRAPLAGILVRGRVDGWDEAAALLTRKDARLLRDRLFRAALIHGVVTDLEIELLLTAFRRRLLLKPDLSKVRVVYEFACVLIRQCLNNEYVFFADEAEITNLSELAIDIDGLLEGDPGATGAFLLLSLYRSFRETLGQEARPLDKVKPKALRAVLDAELALFRLETSHAERLPRLTAITDETSRLVAGQYKEDPYPRWLSLEAPQQGSALDRLGSYFSSDELAIVDGSCDVLIAGAGTGRQAVYAAIEYGNEARVLAFDLSAPSLAYGARMAESFGTKNLRFAVGDILRLDETQESYDVIECVGVLHHMADPCEGWRALIRRLRPGGLMLVGLYSALSRRIIQSLSEEPDWPGSGVDEDEIRTYRRTLVHRHTEGDEITLTQSPDFFTKSGFRDLTLHVSERQFTIPEIHDILIAEGLEFHGFTVTDDTRRSYAERFPDDVPQGTLKNWWVYEQEDPRTFAGMYLFWCRRPAE